METNISGNSWSEIRSQVDPKNQKQGANGRSEVTTQRVRLMCKWYVTKTSRTLTTLVSVWFKLFPISEGFLCSIQNKLRFYDGYSLINLMLGWVIQ